MIVHALEELYRYRRNDTKSSQNILSSAISVDDLDSYIRLIRDGMVVSLHRLVVADATKCLEWHLDNKYTSDRDIEYSILHAITSSRLECLRIFRNANCNLRFSVRYRPAISYSVHVSVLEFLQPYYITSCVISAYPGSIEKRLCLLLSLGNVMST